MSACYRKCCAVLASCGPCCDPAAIDNWGYDKRQGFISAVGRQLLWPDLSAHLKQRWLEFYAWVYATGGYADDGGPSAQDILILGA